MTETSTSMVSAFPRFFVILYSLSTEERVCLAMSTGSFHGVSFNPFDTSLIATANAHDGVILYDIRRPEKYVLNLA